MAFKGAVRERPEKYWENGKTGVRRAVLGFRCGARQTSWLKKFVCACQALAYSVTTRKLLPIERQAKIDRRNIFCFSVRNDQSINETLNMEAPMDSGNMKRLLGNSRVILKPAAVKGAMPARMRNRPKNMK